MDHNTVATLLWLSLGMAFVLALVGIGLRSPRLLVVSGVIELVFGILAIFSIGIFIITIALIQFAIAFWMTRQNDMPHDAR
jgi:amino acid transporter